MKYCEGIDCSWCGVPEPCIYKIANRLQTQLKEKETENKKLKTKCKELKKLSCKFKEYCTCNTEKFLQTLNDIKDYCNKYPQNSIEFKKQILQKISEIEDYE